MFRRTLLSLASLSVVVLAAGFRTSAPVKWPPWLSIESPVNPFDQTARGAVLLVHATFREGQAQLSDLTGSAEGMVNGTRRSVPLHFTEIGRPNVFALRQQWPSEGAWVLRIALRTTTAIVALDRGEVASVRVPTTSASGDRLPRAVTADEVDSTLAAIARR